MNILQELQDFITEFNKQNDIDFEIDSIRIEFSKQYKLPKLQEIGKWRKVQKNSNILHKLKKRLAVNEVTSAYRLEDYNIYYYNSNSDKPKYRKAEMIIFGMKQYHKDPPPQHIVEKLLSILKDVSNIDLCFDLNAKPSIDALSSVYPIRQYVSKDGTFGETFYINKTLHDTIEKVTIYNKAYKNKLDGVLWRIEAKMHIPNVKVLALPLSDFKSIIDIARGNND